MSASSSPYYGDKHAAPGGSLTVRVVCFPEPRPSALRACLCPRHESLQFTDTAPGSSTVGNESSIDSERLLLKLNSHSTDSLIVEDTRDQYYATYDKCRLRRSSRMYQIMLSVFICLRVCATLFQTTEPIRITYSVRQFSLTFDPSKTLNGLDYSVIRRFRSFVLVYIITTIIEGGWG